MTVPALLLKVAALMLVAACGTRESADNWTSANGMSVPGPVASANELATGAPSLAPGEDGKAFMVGAWSAIDQDCSRRIVFRPDGTVTTPIGDARWAVAGDRLSFDYGDGSKPTVSTVKAIDSNRIEITHPSGSKEIEKRC